MFHIFRSRIFLMDKKINRLEAKLLQIDPDTLHEDNEGSNGVPYRFEKRGSGSTDPNQYFEGRNIKDG